MSDKPLSIRDGDSGEIVEDTGITQSAINDRQDRLHVLREAISGTTPPYSACRSIATRSF